MTTSPRRAPPFLLISALFFVSGATALSAEVVLNKLLTYVFGSSHLATSTVLAAYMAGLSAGAWLMGRTASRLRRPVLAYAALELAIGLFYALLPLLFGPFQRFGVALASPLADAPAALTLARFGLSFALVFVPTLMMGGTLPTLVSAFHHGTALRLRLPVLYAVNTLGAAAGTLLASYAAVPVLGLDGTLYTCAALNFGVSVAALIAARSLPDRDGSVEAAEEVAADEPQAAWHLPARSVYALAFAQGALSFVLEVVWAHLIGTVIGVTTYAFALMLFAILLGIGLGSFLLPAISRRTKLPPASLFVGAMVVLALGVALSLRGWDDFTTVVGATKSLAAPGHFWGRELMRLAFCLAMLLPATLAMGVSLPSLAASAKVQGAAHGAWVGRVFAANTLGTITGSLLCGFVLLGRLGSERILQLAVAGALLLALAGVLLGRAEGSVKLALGPRPRAIFGGAALAAAVLALAFRGWDIQFLTMGSHYYWAPANRAALGAPVRVLEDAQSGFITTSKTDDGLLTLRTNGKYEGNSAAGEFQDLFALFGGLYIKHYERAALVGIGPSRTLRILYDMPFRHIEAVEFSPAIIEAAYRDFPEFAKAPFDDHERVQVICDDGRNHLQLSQHQYDYVAIAITGAAFSGSGNIYSRDFFEAVKGRLKDDGIFMLWIQVHHVFPEDVRSVIYTARQVFPHLHFYTDKERFQGYVLASKSELTVDPRLVTKLGEGPVIGKTLAYHGLGSALDLVERNVFTSDEELNRYFASDRIAGKPVLLSDLNPAFEYSTPYGLAQQGWEPYDFEPFSNGNLPKFDPPLSDAEREKLEARRVRAGGRSASR